MKVLTAIVATAALAATTLSAFATPIESFTNPLTGTALATVNPGGSFSIDVGLLPDEPFTGFSLYLNANQAGFSITSDTSKWSGPSGNPLNFPNNNKPFPAPIPVTGNGNSTDFGFDAQFPTQNIAIGNYQILTLEVQVSDTMKPGEYTLFSTHDSEISDASLSPQDIHHIPSSDFSVNVVPEPASLLLLLAGSPLLGLRRRRRC